MVNKHIEPRKPQTKVKHIILEQYEDRWGGIILSGSRWSGSTEVPHLIYVDCDGSHGRYDGELEDQRAKRITPYTVFGSPVIGVRGLDKMVNNPKGVRVRTNAIIIEKDAATYAELKKSLALAGFGGRVRETTDFHSLRDGEIALVRGDSTRMTAKLLNYTTKSSSTYALYLIDPWGAQGVPLQRFVAPIISSDHHDAIIYMPYYDLHKKSGLTTKPKLDDEELNRIHDHDAMFDDNGAWQDIAREIDPAAVGWQPRLPLETEDAEMIDPDTVEPWRYSLSRDREQMLVEHYQRQLKSKDGDLIVKRIPLPFPECDLTMYYLYLTTHNGTGALEMNKLLYDAGLLSTELRQKLRDVTKRPAAQLSFLDLAEIQSTIPKPPRPSTEDIADDIFEHIFMGRRRVISQRVVYQLLADTPYFPGEVKRAIKLLETQCKISFGPNMGHNTIIRSGTA